MLEFFCREGVVGRYTGNALTANTFNATPHTCKVPGVEAFCALCTRLLEVRPPLVQALLLPISGGVRVGAPSCSQHARSCDGSVYGPFEQFYGGMLRRGFLHFLSSSPKMTAWIYRQPYETNF